MDKKQFSDALDWLAIIFLIGTIVIVLGVILIAFILECVKNPLLFFVVLFFVTSMWSLNRFVNMR